MRLEAFAVSGRFFIFDSYSLPPVAGLEIVN